MKLTYSQKRYIQKHYPQETVEGIAKTIHTPIDIIQKHISDNQILFKKPKEQTEPIKKINLIEHIPYLVLLAMFIILVYANGFGAEFVSDDVYAILRNEAALKSQNYLFIAPTFILRSLQYLIAYKIGGFTPFLFRIWNIVFHVGFVWMTYLIVPFFSKKKFLPFFVASFAAIHPMMIESVIWISGGIYAQSGFSLLLSFYLYLKFKVNKSKKYFIFSLISYVCALSASEKVIIFPFIIGLYELTFGSLKNTWKQVSAFFGISFVWGLILITRISERLVYLRTEHGAPTKFTVENPFFLIPSAIGTYLKLFIWPRHLTLYQSEFQFVLIQFLFLLLITVAFFAGIAISYRKNKSIFFWLCFFIITLFPTLNPFGLSWLVAERYSYLGSVGLYFAFSAVLYKLIENKKYQTIGYIIFSILLLAFSVRTIVRNIDWQNEDKLWVATAKASPSDPKTHNNLGDMYARQGNLQKAAESFARAIELSPRYPDAYHNLGNVLRQAGHPEEAEKMYLKAIELKPGLWQSYQNIAAMNFERKDYKKAEELILKAIEVYPTNPDLYVNLGVVYTNMGDQKRAIQTFKTALQFDPQNETALRAMSELTK